MMAVAATRRSEFRSHMATDTRQPTTQEQARAIGAALKALRDRADLTQEQAAERMGVTRQGWQKYEAEGKPVVLRTDMQDRLAAAIGLTREDLLRERDRQAGSEPSQHNSVSEAGRVYELPVLGRVRAGPTGPLLFDAERPDGVFDAAWMFGPNARTLRVAGDQMTGFVESGQLVIYDMSVWPSRGQGCVVELKTGELHVAEYQQVSQGALSVRLRAPEETLSFPMSDVAGVYMIRFRGG